MELAGQIRELAMHTLRREYHDIDPSEARVLLFDGGDEPLAPFGHELATKAARALTDLGVELHMHSIVTEVDADGLEVRGQDGETTRYAAGTVLWAAGVTAAPLADAVAHAAGAEQDRAGRIKVAPDLTVPGHPEISVVGDVMSLDDLPGVAEVAMQTGFHVARRIKADVRGEPAPKPFKYRDLGLGGVHLARLRGGVVRAAARRGPDRLARVAGHPHHVPHRLPQPGRRAGHLGADLQPGDPAGAALRPPDRAARRRLRGGPRGRGAV